MTVPRSILSCYSLVIRLLHFQAHFQCTPRLDPKQKNDRLVHFGSDLVCMKGIKMNRNKWNWIDTSALSQTNQSIKLLASTKHRIWWKKWNTHQNEKAHTKPWFSSFQADCARSRGNQSEERRGYVRSARDSEPRSLGRLLRLLHVRRDLGKPENVGSPGRARHFRIRGRVLFLAAFLRKANKCGQIMILSEIKKFPNARGLPR